jgi:hypothetical protein
LAIDCPRVRDATTGVVFLGTPHEDANSEVVLRAVQNTVQSLRQDHHFIDEEDIRHYSAAVSAINKTFIATKPKNVQILSVWEQKASSYAVDGKGDASETVRCPVWSSTVSLLMG